MVMKPIFQNIPNYLIAALEQAQTEILVAVSWVTHPGIYAAMLAACGRGIKVELVLQYDAQNIRKNGRLDFEKLIAAGGKLYGFQSKNELMHHKFCVIDGKQVLAGSFNWSKSKHADGLVHWDCAPHDFVNTFLDEFERVKARSVHYQSIDYCFENESQQASWQLFFHEERSGDLPELDWLERAFRTGKAKAWYLYLPNRLDSVFQLPEKWLRKPAACKRFTLKIKPGDMLLACSKEGNIHGLGMVEVPPLVTPASKNILYIRWVIDVRERPVRFEPPNMRSRLIVECQERLRVMDLMRKGSV